MQCSVCANVIDAGAGYCPYCSAAVGTMQPGRAVVPERTSGIAARRVHPRFITDPGIAMPLLVAAGLGIASYVALSASTHLQGRIWDLFMGSWVQQLEVFLFFAVMLLLVRKRVLIASERKRVSYVRDQVLAPIFTERVSRDDVPFALETMQARLQSLRLRDLLSQRVEHVLRALGTSGSPSTALEVMRASDGLDRDRSEGTYTVLRTFLWALPILGFIGTVLGIGDAVAGFSSFITHARDLHAVNVGMRDQLGSVTHGLAVAFDTTLLGLAFSMPGVFAMALLRRREDELLTDMEQFCFEQVAPALAARPAVVLSADEGARPDVSEELDSLVHVAQVLRGLVRDMIGDLTTRSQGAHSSELSSRRR